MNEDNNKMERYCISGEKPFYEGCVVYRHIRLDKNEPFYIGIGKTMYRAYEKRKRSALWNNIVNKTDYDVEILFYGLTWEVAKEKEIEFIKLYGRKDLNNGTLVNFTNGGDGSLGIVKSFETRKKISKANKGRKLSDEHKKKLSESKKGLKNPWYGKKLPKEIRDKMSKSQKGRKHSEETKRKMKINAKSRANTGKKVIDIKTKNTYNNLKQACIALNLIYNTEAGKIYRNSPLARFKYI